MKKNLLMSVIIILFLSTSFTFAINENIIEYDTVEQEFFTVLYNNINSIFIEDVEGKDVKEKYLESLKEIILKNDQEKLVSFLLDENLILTVFYKENNLNNLEISPQDYGVENFFRSEPKNAVPKDVRGNNRPEFTLRWNSIIKGTYQINPSTNRITVLSKTGTYSNLQGYSDVISGLRERNYSVGVSGTTITYSSYFESTILSDVEYPFGLTLIYPLRSTSITL